MTSVKQIVYKNMQLYAMGACVCFLILSWGCSTSMTVTPKIQDISNKDFQIVGNLVCEGNTQYAPRCIVHNPNTVSKLTFQYKYFAMYGKHDIPEAIALFNPLTIVGFPTGENSLTVTGKLDVMKGGEILKTYTSICVLEKTRNIFSEGETFSEIRRKGLLAIRDNLEAQMFQDRDFLLRNVITD